MRVVDSLYPDCIQDDYFSSPYDYSPIINNLGEVLIRVDDQDYQGDSRILYKNYNQYGYLIFGWGSCSGCDALQGCENMDDVQSLYNQLRDSIKWFDTLEELQQYFRDKDWELDYCWHQKETKQFIEEVLNYK